MALELRDADLHDGNGQRQKEGHVDRDLVLVGVVMLRHDGGVRKSDLCASPRILT